MKKLFILLFTFITQPLFADYITHNTVNGCNANLLNIFDGDTYLFPVFTINSYNCSNGYYLPADSLGCVECPYGYDCPGGVYEYKEYINQGISYKTPIDENVYHGCAVDLLFPDSTKDSNLKPVFIPNTITLNWNDGTNITTTQCRFGETITIPNPPTRPGYKFGGWRVKRRN